MTPGITARGRSSVSCELPDLIYHPRWRDMEMFARTCSEQFRAPPMPAWMGETLTGLARPGCAGLVKAGRGGTGKDALTDEKESATGRGGHEVC